MQLCNFKISSSGKYYHYKTILYLANTSVKGTATKEEFLSEKKNELKTIEFL